MTQHLLRFAAPVFTGLFILAAWQLICTTCHIPPYLFPAPSAIGASFVAGWPVLLGALFSTLKVTLLAFALATVFGTLTAFLFVQSRALEISLLPYAIMLQVTPIAAVAPLIIILIKNLFWALTLCAAVIAVFPIISNTTIGLRSVDPGLLAYFRMNKATRLQILLRLRIPGAMPFLMAGLRISSGLSLIGAVVAEFVAGSGEAVGLAWRISESASRLQTPLTFAALLLLSLTGLALNALVTMIEKRLLRHWHPAHGEAS